MTILSIPEAINRILMNYDTEENDKNIELFIQALRHSEGLNENIKVDFTKGTSSICESSIVPLEDTDSIEEQLLTMVCFEEIDYYYLDKLTCKIKDI
jgi:hypothetical protein